jgi:hypothetical protein
MSLTAFTSPYAGYHRRRQARLVADEQRRQALRAVSAVAAQFEAIHADVQRALRDGQLQQAAQADGQLHLVQRTH